MNVIHECKDMKCKTSNWGCVYHACMTDECQKRYVLKHDKTLGKGKCQVSKNEKKR